MKTNRIIILLLCGALLFGAFAFQASSAKPAQRPFNLIAWDSGRYVQLNWDADLTIPTRGYNVYRLLNTSDTWVKLNEAIISSTVFVDFSAPRPELVSYRVNIVNETDELPATIISISTGSADKNGATAQAVTAAAFSKNDIISDAQLINSTAMSAAQIQSFLSNQSSALANYSSGGKTAAQRIYDDCQTHGISPYVVLATLQKEKGLIKNASANPNNFAMGWNTGDSSTSDFANQLYYGTRQFKLYYNNLGGYGWTVGQPHAVSDGTVTPANTATAGLYIYTPWIGQGGGGAAGIGGNYLFWDLWYNTFGFTTTGILSVFPPTVITSRNSTSPYATTKNAFWVSDHSLAGQCTWYAYGRVIELSEAGYLDPSAAAIMYNAFWGKFGRDAKNWPSFLGGEWTSTNGAPLPMEKRKPGMLAVWPYGTNGHVGFVEEISADKTQYRLSDFNRGLDESYRNIWYSFAGTSDLLLGGYPSFYQLPLPSGACSATVGQGTSGAELAAFQNAFSSAGGQNVLGCATAAVRFDGFTSFAGTVGHYQTFANGDIEYHSNGSRAGEAYGLVSAFSAKWALLGYTSSNPLGYPISVTSQPANSCYGTQNRYQSFEGGSLSQHLSGAKNGQVFEVHGAIHRRWELGGFAVCPLGMPISDETTAQPSGATGSSGKLNQFEGGQIYWKTGASAAFEVHGAIYSTYVGLGGSAGWLGFPTSNEFVAPTGYARNDFEGGYITTTDGSNFQAFPYGGSGSSIPLNAGWNLISLPLQPSNHAITTVLSGIAGKYSAVWGWDGSSQSWRSYFPSNPGFSNLSTMDAGNGYWLYMTSPASLSVSGSTPSKTVSLVNQWNLVGYNSTNQSSITNALSSINGKYLSVWAWNSSTQAYQSYIPSNPGFSTLSTMDTGRGYWIYATQNTSWTIP